MAMTVAYKHHMLKVDPTGRTDFLGYALLWGKGWIR